MHADGSHETALPGLVGKRLSVSWVRLRGAGVVVVCLVPLALAWCLTPRASGYGTHEQLAVPPCSFLVRTGYPCPSCGVTTAFVAAAHGRLVAGLQAQVFGVLLFAAVVLAAAAGAAELATGRNLLSAVRPRWWWAPAALGSMLAGWGLKIVLGLAGGELPTH
jgi:hypothetical protein